MLRWYRYPINAKRPLKRAVNAISPYAATGRRYALSPGPATGDPDRGDGLEAAKHPGQLVASRGIVAIVAGVIVAGIVAIVAQESIVVESLRYRLLISSAS